MDEFDLDLRTVEDEIDDPDGDDPGVVLGVLDGRTSASEWLSAVENGKVLVLAVDGDLNRLAGRFAGDVSELGGDLISFREMLVVVPPDVTLDAERIRDEQ